MNAIDEYVRDNHPHYYPPGQADCWFCSAIKRLDSAAKIVRKHKVKSTDLDVVSEFDCPADYIHDWCYSCVNQLLETIAEEIE